MGTLMRIGIVVAVVVILSAVASPAHALRDEVQAAVALYQELRFDEARAAFERAMRLEGNRAADLAAIHLHLGLLHGAEDREEQAEEHFRMALAVDPMVSLPAGQPPKITRPFSSAREFWGGARLRVVHRPPRGWVVGRPADVRIQTADDRLDLVSAARLYVWRVGEDGDEDERTYRQDGGGPIVFPVPEELLEEEGDIRYRVELLGPASSILLELEADELTVHVGARPPDPEPGVRTIVRTTGPAPPPPVWEQWWFWTVIGVVVAGAAAGTTAALLVPGEGVEFSAPVWATE